MPENPTTASATLWQPRGAWAGIARAGRHGAPQGEPGIRLTLLETFSLASVIAADGREAALQEIVSARLGLTLPEAGAAAIGGGRRLVWSGPRQWLAVAGPGGLDGLADALHGIAAVTDQSGSRALVRIAGPDARRLLAKGVAVDLHPRAFRAGSAAATVIAHLGVQLWQVEDEADDGPAYELAVGRSFSVSLWSWLSEAGAAFGIAVA